MDKLILKKIAKRWSKAILEASEMDSEFKDAFLSHDERSFVCDEVKKIANRICPGESDTTLEDIIMDYYECDIKIIKNKSV